MDIKKYSAILVAAIIVLGITLAVYLTSNKQTVKSKAQTPSNIFILKPADNEQVSGALQVLAKIVSNEDPSKLYGFFRVNGQKSQELKFRRLNNTEISLSGSSNETYSNGNYALDIYLYNLSSGTPSLIDKTTKNIIISN